MNEYKIIHGDCLSVMDSRRRFQCIFADPPDNMGLKYAEYNDKLPDRAYAQLLCHWVDRFTRSADIVWLSFNPRWVLQMSNAVQKYMPSSWELKPCVQRFTFGQYNGNDLGVGHRLLWRLKHKDAPLYPDQIKIPSQRQLTGDKRAKAGGRVPDDVFDFPRVTGNSKQRRKWHPTQLHEDLVERCVLLSTAVDDSVCDPFAGTGTTLRVCQKINRHCTLIETDSGYCKRIAQENGWEFSDAA